MDTAPTTAIQAFSPSTLLLHFPFSLSILLLPYISALRLHYLSLSSLSHPPDSNQLTPYIRSLIAHEDSVTCVRFQPETHYFFSSGKDGVLKYWDADRCVSTLRAMCRHYLRISILLNSSLYLSISFSPILTVVRSSLHEEMHNEFISMEK